MSNRQLLSSRAFAVAALAFVSAAWTGAALARGVQQSGGGKGDVVGYCAWPSLGVPFLGWGDLNVYLPVDGGAFESGTSTWTLAGGAALLRDNEAFYTNSRADRYSLAVPNGASVTSPPVCVTALSPVLRFFARNTGGADSRMSVTLNYTEKDGKQRSEKVADLTGGAAWAPTNPIKFLKPVMDVLKKNGQTSVTFTFFVQKQTVDPGKWQIDDIYVDPLKSG
jgi:hypothetical protein